MVKMDFLECLGEFILTWFESITSFIVWYTRNVLYYPIIIVFMFTVLQYFTRYDGKIRFISCYMVYFFWTTLMTVSVGPLCLLNLETFTKLLWGAYVLRPVAKIIGIEFELRNAEVLSPKTGAAVIAANHQSCFDVLGMFTVWHVMQKCTAIARKKVFYVWPFGLVAWLAGVVFIDRIPSYKKTFEKINKTAEYICKERAKLWMFVEGTRNKRPEKLLPLKKGAFRVAICCQVPIIPVIFSPYYFIDGKTMYFGKGKIIIEALEPVSTTGLTLDDLDDLVDRVYKLMSNKNDEFRKTLAEKNNSAQLERSKNL